MKRKQYCPWNGCGMPNGASMPVPIVCKSCGYGSEILLGLTTLYSDNKIQTDLVKRIREKNYPYTNFDKLCPRCKTCDSCGRVGKKYYICK